MFSLLIPGSEPVNVEHLVLDYNGTLAVGGQLVEGVLDRLRKLAQQLTIHIVTADTFGSVREQLGVEGFEIRVLRPGEQDKQKRDYLCRLGPGNAIAIGNGQNDRLMFDEAALAFVILEGEGTSVAALQAGDVLYRSITDALDALLEPRRLIASLRR